MDAVSANVYRIDPLKGAENYAVWKIKMTDILTDQSLWEYVSGLIPVPTDSTEKATWEKNDRKALSMIRLRVADKMLVFIASVTVSKDAWDTLHSLLESQGPLGIVLARRKLFRAQCEEGTSVEEHIRILRGYQEDLMNLGQKISDSEFSIILLTSLPDTWNGYISSIDTSALIARVLEHDCRLKIQGHANTALTGKFSKKKYNPNVTCYGCHKKGHIKPNCLEKSKSDPKKKDEKPKKSRNSQAHEGVDEFAFMGTIEDVAEDLSNSALTAVTSDAWLADSACTSHVAADKSLFVNFIETPSHYIKGLGKLPTLGKGSIKLVSSVDDKSIPLHLQDVLYVPDAPHNLISVSKATSSGCQVLFSDNGVKFVGPNKEILANGTKIANLYPMNVKSASSEEGHVVKSGSRSWNKWHRIMGHLNMGSVKMLKSKQMVLGMDVDESEPILDQCSACIVAKQHVIPFPKESLTEIAEVGDLTVSDVWGPAQTTGIRGEKYFLMCTDGKSRRSMIYFLKQKSEALEKFKFYKAWVETQIGKKLKKLRVDGRGEYVGNEFRNYLLAEGIALEITAAHSPSQNGIAERGNRTIVEHARAMIHSQDPYHPYYLWPEAVSYANYLRNRSPARALPSGKTPDEIFWGRKPYIGHLEEFGSKCWVLQQDGKNRKLDPKSRPFIFVGISDSTKGYRYWNSHQVLTSRNVIFSTDVTEVNQDFDEIVVPNPVEIEGESVDKSNLPIPLIDPIKDQKDQKLPLREKSTCVPQKEPGHYKYLNDPSLKRLKSAEADQSNLSWEETIDYAMVVNSYVDDDPRDLVEARSRSEWPEWKKAMDEEVDQLLRLGTYVKAELLDDRKPINCRSVFRLKRDDIGEIARFKARVVAKGFSQIPGIDFFETYAPVMRLDTLRLMLVVATHFDMIAHVMDVVGAYLL